MRYAVVFALLATLLVFNAVMFVEAWWLRGLLGWIGLSFAVPALAYAIQSPRLFGKRSDGRIACLPWLLLLPYRALGLAVAGLATRWSKEPPWHRVDDGLTIGRRLRGSEIPPQVTAVLDCTCEFSDPPALRRLAYRCLPMLDGGAADAQAILDTVRDFADAPGHLYLHCAQGHGRTGLMAALLLVARNPGLRPREALARLVAIRPGIGLSARQSAMIDAIGDRLARRTA